MAAAYLATPELRQKLREAVQVRADRERRSHSHVLAHMQNHPTHEHHHADTQAVYTSPNNTCGWNPEASQPDVLLGLMASDVRLGLRGLRDWCDALKLDFMLPEVKVSSGLLFACGLQGTVVARC